MKTIVIIALSIVCISSTFAQRSVKIGHINNVPPGSEITVPITIKDSLPILELGGFDLIFIYDSLLSFQSVSMGQLLINCQWEYFTYSQPFPYTLRLVTIADLNNGSVHPTCYGDTAGILADVTFLVTGGDSLTMRWKWYDCGDNSFSSTSGNTLYIADQVYAYNGTSFYNITYDTTFPTENGAPEECVSGGSVRSFDFYNGGIFVVYPDNTPPVAHCPGDITADSDSGSCGAIVTFEATVTDNKPGATISCNPPSGSFFNEGETIVTCIAVDAAGNSDTCNFTITVNDVEPPVAICPGDITVDNDSGLCGAIVTFEATATDNCTVDNITASPPSGSMFMVGNNRVDVVATDAAGNVDSCFFFVNVNEAEAPILTCLNDTVVSNDPGQCGAIVNFETTASDNCHLTTITSTPPSGSLFLTGTTTVELVANDFAGNADTCYFNVTVVDSEPPQAMCVDIDIPNDPGQCGAIVNFTPSAVDNCPGVMVTASPPSGTYFLLRTTPVEVIATDAGGLVDTCYFDVTVYDNENPVVTCPDDISVPNDSGVYGAVVTFDPSATDNCTIVTVTTTPPSGTFLPIGTTQVEVVAVDFFGHSDTCYFNAEVYPADTDSDGVVDLVDNCPYDANPDQTDTDNDGIGDACCCQERGNADNIINPSGFPVDVADLSYLVYYLFSSGAPPPCPEQANADGVTGPNGPIDVADMSYLVSFLFDGGPPPPACQ